MHGSGRSGGLEASAGGHRVVRIVRCKKWVGYAHEPPLIGDEEDVGRTQRVAAVLDTAHRAAALSTMTPGG